MIKIILADGKTEADMNAISGAFAISRDELEEGVNSGTISRWFELGEGNSDNKPHMILQSRDLCLRVTVDQIGNVISSTPVPTGKPPVNQSPAEHEIEDAIAGKVVPKAFDPAAVVDANAAHHARVDALLDEALQESSPASDPVAISFDTPERPLSSSTKDW